MKAKIRAAASVIAMTLVALALGAMLASCGPNGPTPSSVTTAALDAFKAGDLTELAKYYKGTADLGTVAQQIGGEELAEGVAALSEDQEEVIEALYAKVRDFDYKVSNEKVNGDTATVVVEITTYDFGAYFTNVLSDYINQAFAIVLTGGGSSSEEMSSMLMGIVGSNLENLGDKTRTTKATISLTKGEDGTWLIDTLDETAVDALLGGAITDMSKWADSLATFGQAA